MASDYPHNQVLSQNLSLIPRYRDFRSIYTEGLAGIVWPLISRVDGYIISICMAGCYSGDALIEIYVVSSS